MAAQAASAACLLTMAVGALQHVAARYLALHKATAKLSYVSSSLFIGLLEEGFCTAEESQEEAVGGEGGTFKEAKGMVSTLCPLPELQPLHMLLPCPTLPGMIGMVGLRQGIGCGRGWAKARASRT
jgi:hypothetical protein